MITTLIAVLSAIFVVLLNQRFNSSRSRKDKLIAMIESLYEEIAKSNRIRLDIHHAVVTDYDKPQCDELVVQLHAEYLAALDKARMITELYFGGLDINIEKLMDSYLRVSRAYGESQSLGEYLSEYSSEKESINNLYAESVSRIRGLMKKTMH